MAETAAERAAERAATIANPGPLGLSAFALTTFVLSSINAGFLVPSGTGPNIVVGLALFYGGVVQILAGMWEFRAGNTFSATAFSSYGGFWLALGVIYIPGTGILTAFGQNMTSLHASVGLFLLGWTIFTGLMFFGTLRNTLALMGVFLFLFLTFLSLTIAQLGGPSALNTFTVIGGWLGIITALFAWYTAWSSIAVFKLPVGSRS